MKTKSQKNVAFLFISLLLLPLFWEQNPLGVAQAQSNDSKTIAATNNKKKRFYYNFKKRNFIIY